MGSISNNCPSSVVSALSILSKSQTLTKPSAPMVMSSPSSMKNCSIIPTWHGFLPFFEISTLIKPPSQSSMLPHSEPDSTFPSGSSTKPVSGSEFGVSTYSKFCHNSLLYDPSYLTCRDLVVEHWTSNCKKLQLPKMTSSPFFLWPLQSYSSIAQMCQTVHMNPRKKKC